MINGQDFKYLIQKHNSKLPNPINLIKKDKEISLKKKYPPSSLTWHFLSWTTPYQCFHDVESSYSLTSMSKNKKTLKIIVQNWSANTSSNVKRYSIQYSSLHWTPFLKKKISSRLFFLQIKTNKKIFKRIDPASCLRRRPLIIYINLRELLNQCQDTAPTVR